VRISSRDALTWDDRPGNKSPGARNVDNGQGCFLSGQPGHPLDNTEFNTFCTEHIGCLDQPGQYGRIETIGLSRQYLGAWTIERARH
jgi:hypothetical protein